MNNHYCTVQIKLNNEGDIRLVTRLLNKNNIKYTDYAQDFLNTQNFKFNVREDELSEFLDALDTMSEVIISYKVLDDILEVPLSKQEQKVIKNIQKIKKENETPVRLRKGDLKRIKLVCEEISSLIDNVLSR